MYNIDGFCAALLHCCRYVQAAAFRPGYRNNFGYPMTYNISGTLHTHVLAWKVDLDIAGQTNSVSLHNMKVTFMQEGFQGVDIGQLAMWKSTSLVSRQPTLVTHGFCQCLLSWRGLDVHTLSLQVLLACGLGSISKVG